MTQEKNSLYEMKTNQSNLFEEQKLKLDQTIQKLKETQKELIDSKEKFKNEMMTQTKLTTLYKTSFEESNNRVIQLEGKFSINLNIFSSKLF